jgi:hypothetical protein
VEYLLFIFLALAESHFDSSYSDHPVIQEGMILPQGFTKLECFKDGTIRIRSNDQLSGLIKPPHHNKLFIEYTNRGGGIDIGANGKYTLHCADKCTSKMLFKKIGSETLNFKTYKPNKHNDLLKKMPEEYKKSCDFDYSGNYLTCINEKRHAAVWDIENEKFILKSNQDLEIISIQPEKKKIIAQVILPKKKNEELKSPIVMFPFEGNAAEMTIADASDVITPRPIDSESTFFYRTNSEARQFNINSLSTKKIAEVPLEQDFKMPELQINGNFGLQYSPSTNTLTWKDLFSEMNLRVGKIPYSMNSFCLLGPHTMAWVENQDKNSKLHVVDLKKLYGLKKEKLPTFEETWKKLGYFYNTSEYLHLLNHPEWESQVLEKLKSEKNTVPTYSEQKMKSLFKKIDAQEYKTRIDSNAEIESLITALPLENLKKIKLLAEKEIKTTQQQMTWQNLLPKIDHRIEHNLPSSFEIKTQRAQAFLNLQQPANSTTYDFTALVDAKTQLPSSKFLASEPMPHPHK